MTYDNDVSAARVHGMQSNAGPVSGAEVSRREFLQLASAALSLAAIPASAAQPGSSGYAESIRPVTVQLTVNGQTHGIRIDARQSLLDDLREVMGLTGTKKGCNQGACGACTVLIDGQRMLSCLTLAAMHDGASVTTIEGLVQGDRLHPLQAAFVQHEAFQCGYCTPGQIMSGVGCIAEGHARSPE